MLVRAPSVHVAEAICSLARHLLSQLFYNDGRLRVVVLSANLRDDDFDNVENVRPLRLSTSRLA